MEVALRRYIFILGDIVVQFCVSLFELGVNTFYWWNQNKFINTERRAVLITGCDSGFGLASARYFAGKGVTVFAGCLTDEGKNALDTDENVVAFNFDVTSDDSTEDAVKLVRNELERSKKVLWCVISNAGTPGVMCPILWTRVSDYARAVDVNLIGNIRTILAFLPMMNNFSNELYMTGISVSTVAPLFYPTQVATVWQSIRKRYEDLDDALKEEYASQLDELVEERRAYCERMGRGNRVEEVAEVYFHAAFGQVPRHTYFLGRRHPRVLIFGRLPDFLRARLIHFDQFF